MKKTPEIILAEKNMAPGVITAEGFLGDDDLSLSEIITRDECEMRALKMDFNKVADILEHLIREGEKGMGEPITVDDRWLVQILEAKGSLPCPFGHQGLYRKTAAEITCLKSRETLLVTELSLHLLREHHFMQGKGSPFRLEPGKLGVIFCE